MTEDPVEEEILRPLQALYRSPHFEQSTQGQIVALESYARVLKPYDRATLRAAWEATVATHGKPTWPSAQVLVSECRRIQSLSRTPLARSGKADMTARRMAWDKAKGERLALVAAQNGVAHSFKCAILYDGKRPEDVNIPQLRRNKQDAQITADRIEADENHFYNGRLIGVIEGGAKTNALVMWANIQDSERITRLEIMKAQPQREPEPRADF